MHNFFFYLLIWIVCPGAIFQLAGTEELKILNRYSVKHHNPFKALSDPDQKDLIPRHLLIIGCGRSGTTYMCKVLKASGLDVEHEYMASHGSVSWLMTPADAEWAPWGPLSKDYQFTHTFHQVRDPVKVIQSMYNVPPRATWEWVSLFVPEIQPDDSNLTKCAKYWYYWNLIAETRAEATYRIEDFNENYQEVGDLFGIIFDQNVVDSISKKTKSQRKSTHKSITWKKLKTSLDPDLYDKIRSQAKRYGYKTPEN